MFKYQMGEIVRYKDSLGNVMGGKIISRHFKEFEAGHTFGLYFIHYGIQYISYLITEENITENNI